jgi:dihydrolipoamide dehydrogenase
VQGVRKGADSVTAIIEAGGKVQEIVADRLISAVGIVGNVEELGLEGTKIKVDRTHVADRRRWAAPASLASMPSAT